MQMEIENLKRFSLELAQVMDDIGVNEDMVSLRRHVSLLINRYLLKCLTRVPWTHFTFGSQSEGSTTIGMMSDTDNCFCSKIDVACVHLSDCQEYKNNYLVIKEPTSLPQCCYLQFVRILKNNRHTPISRELKNDIKPNENQYIFDEQGRLLFNSMFLVNEFLLNFENVSSIRVRQHGPAFTFTHHDIVIAIRCMTLPNNCRFFFTRPRPGHWPKQETLSKAEQCEVYMLPPGAQGHIFGYDDERQFSFIKLQYQSKYVDSLFRMSTNMTERLLMFDLNIVQIKAYVITKMIRKEFLQPLVDERLSTFHMKTALLFTIELFPEDIWRDDNLVQCVIYCLNTLRRCLKRGYCPHYTISSVNLFVGKLTKNELQIVKENVTEIINSSLHCLRKLCMDDVGWRLSASSLGLGNDNILSGTEIRLNIILEMTSKICHYHEPPFIHRTYNDMKEWVSTIKSAIETDHEYKIELEYIYQYMCSNIASGAASDCIAKGTGVTSDIICMYEASLRSKDITNHLRYASMLVCKRQFDRARSLLDAVENKIESGMIQITELFKQNINVKLKSDQRSSKCTPTEILMEYATKVMFPLVFVISEINCVPGHLIYEKYRAITEDEIQCADIKVRSRCFNHVFESDVKPFLYYLQYLASENEEKKRIANAKLSGYCKSEIHNRTSKHLATALNMFGHVLELENCLEHALIYYRISVAMQPQYNSAYWHLFRLFGHVMYSQFC